MCICVYYISLSRTIQIIFLLCKSVISHVRLVVCIVFLLCYWVSTPHYPIHVRNNVATKTDHFPIRLYINDYKLLASRTLTLACWVEAPRTCVALQLVKLVLYHVLYRVLYRLVFFDFIEFFLVVFQKEPILNTCLIKYKKCLKTIK